MGGALYKLGALGVVAYGIYAITSHMNVAQSIPQEGLRIVTLGAPSNVPTKKEGVKEGITYNINLEPPKVTFGKIARNVETKHHKSHKKYYSKAIDRDIKGVEQAVKEAGLSSYAKSTSYGVVAPTKKGIAVWDTVNRQSGFYDWSEAIQKGYVSGETKKEKTREAVKGISDLFGIANILSKIF